MKIKLFTTLLLFTFCTNIHAQVGINATNTAPHPSAMLDVNSANKGFLLPRTANPASNIAAPATGLMTYNTTTNTPNFFNGSQWQSVTAVSAAGMGFKNMKRFDVSEIWTVPAGVNKIMVEGWGEGGNGATYNYNNGVLIGTGGGAGGYDMNFIDVSPGQIINIDFTEGSTQMTRGGFTILAAYRGIDGDNPYGGVGGRFNFVGASGENGHQLKVSYGNQNATTFNLIIDLGDGGDAYKGGKGGKGQTFVSGNSQTLLYSTLSTGIINGSFPGGGGGAGYTTGGFGGNPLAYIYY